MAERSAGEVRGVLRAMRLGAGGHRGQVRLYDFRRPDKFSKEQLRTLATLHENFCRAATTTLAAALRTAVQVETISVDQCPFSQFLSDLDDPTVLGVFSLTPFAGTALLEVEPAVAFAMVDRLLGGPGSGAVHGRALTDIEAAVMRRVFNALGEALVEPWRSIAEVRPRLEALETNPLFAQFISPTEVVAYLTFSVRLGRQQGELHLCLPYAMLEPYLPQLSARYWLLRDRRGGGEGSQEEKIRRELAEVRLSLSAELGQARLTLGELLGLEVGDVVPLEAPREAPVTVLVAGRRKFRGRPGRSGRHLAVQITEVLRERE